MAGAQNRCLVKTGTVLGAKNGPSKLLMRREKEIIISTSPPPLKETAFSKYVS